MRAVRKLRRTWQANKVWVVTDKGKNKKVLYEGLDWPNGIALHNGTLYVAEHKKISKAENIEANLDKPRRAQHGGLRLQPENQATLLHRQ